MRRKLGVFRNTYKQHGSLWEYIRSYSYARSVLHTSGVTYVHHTGETRNVEAWTWDENGNAISVRSASRDEMANHLKNARTNFKKIKEII